MVATTHRQDNSTREQQIIGGIPVKATRYATGRTEVIIHARPPATPEQANALGYNTED